MICDWSDPGYVRTNVKARLSVLVLAAACGSRKSDTPAPAPSPASGSGAPTMGVLRSPDGTTKTATPEETVATLRTNCDKATTDSTFAVACFSLGQLYDTGTFVTKDSKLAMALHDKACRLGELRACAELGVFYDEGTVVPRDAARAKRLFIAACDGGNGLACNNILYLHPDAVTKEDVTYVLGRYSSICDGGGDAEACFSLGVAYQLGQVITADIKHAIALYTRACNADHPMACNNLGALQAMGEGMPKDQTGSLAMYKKACNLGSREGCLNAGIDPETAAVRIQRP